MKQTIKVHGPYSLLKEQRHNDNNYWFVAYHWQLWSDKHCKCKVPTTVKQHIMNWNTDESHERWKHQYSSFFQITSLSTLNTNILYQCFEWLQDMDLSDLKTTVNLTRYCSIILPITEDKGYLVLKQKQSSVQPSLKVIRHPSFMPLYESKITPQTKSHYTIALILKSNYLIWQLCCRDLCLWCPSLTGRLNSGIIVVYPSDATKNAWLPWCGPQGLQG